MQKILKYSWLFIFISFTLVSCEKVIDLDLNTAEPRLVIEGNITSNPGPYLVSLSTSGDYYTTHGINPVSGANIIISNELGHADTLFEFKPGIYHTSTLTGETNRTYTIVVDYNGKEYSGSETLPHKVYIDSLSYEKMEFTGPGGGGGEDKPRYSIYCTFLDPIETVDYYRFDILVNGIPMGGFRSYYYLASDQLFNGHIVQYPIRWVESQPGDTVTISLHTIGFNTWEYFRTLNDALSGGGMGSTPYNPITNLSNNALGYFGAYAIDSKNLVVGQ
ncbi:MAG: DUF4249 domain-containing protein [Bacteroidetes bacterium]|nr:DUF4249 domain-containing protein [Bacteroidota bacterium]MBL6944631.1 DUF4249 domain-containing protein [Bacteroidales bacterium]